MSNEYALKMLNITKTFPGVIANDNISIECKKGEVLGLLGENGAGKSTLMNILYGLYQPDAGEIFINGKKVNIESPSKAIDLRIGMVHQHFKLVDTLTALENIVLGLPNDGIALNLSPARDKLLRLCEEYELYVDPDTEVWKLPVGQQQWIEILKALYRDAQILVLDEPTAVLTPAESDQLEKAIRKLTEKGKSVIYISHKLREVIEITDNVTVIRDGKYIGTIPTKEATQLKLSEMMVGRPISIDRRNLKKIDDKKPILVMNNVNAKDDRGVHALKNFDLVVNSGEIVGVAGVDGNGQRELAECIAGMRNIESGNIEINGTSVNGIVADPTILGYIPEDRQKTGLVKDFYVSENLILKTYFEKPFTKKGILDLNSIKDYATELIEKYKIKTPSEFEKVKHLSGGNQQKVVIARELDPEPLLDLACHPTRGLDLGAVKNTHDVLVNERNRGAAVLFISAELQEVLAISDRIIVLFRGEIMGEVKGDEANAQLIGQLMLGQTLERGN